jgi:hypothetical protein
MDTKLDTMGEKYDAMDTKLDTMGEKYDAMSAKYDTMDEKYDIMGAKQDTMSERLTRIEIKIENEIDRSIRALSEGHAIINRKLDECIGVEHRVETLEHKMSAVEYTLGN